MPRLTTKAWFGPRKSIGWGWTPRSWEGWAVTGVFLLLAVTTVSAFRGVGRLVGLLVVLVVFGAVMYLTGDPPGGPGFTKP